MFIILKPFYYPTILQNSFSSLLCVTYLLYYYIFSNYYTFFVLLPPSSHIMSIICYTYDRLHLLSVLLNLSC